MTREEAKKVYSLLGEADSGCHVCVASLVDLATELWPEFPWLEWYAEEFGDN